MPVECVLSDTLETRGNFGCAPSSARMTSHLRDDRIDDAMTLPFHVTFDRPFLVAAFEEPQAMLSWAMTKPGFRTGRTVAWLQVRNADLPPTVDPFAFLDRRMEEAGLVDAIALMTSRDVRHHHFAQAEVEGITATCLATVGLSNGGRVGVPRSAMPSRIGTINVLVHVSSTLSEAALVETISIATQARTVALLDLGHLSDGHVVSGTGTDCIVAAAPARGEAERFAGLHTPIGEAVGRAVGAAITEGGRLWCRDWNASANFSAPRHPQDVNTAS
jgi:adenosylcobinamide amidohydrolase